MIKFVLIVLAFNLQAPKDPSILVHRLFATEQLCNKAREHMIKDTPENLRVAAFCIPQRDLNEEIE